MLTYDLLFFFLILHLHPKKSMLVDFTDLPISWQILNQFMFGTSIGRENCLSRRDYHTTMFGAYHVLQSPLCLG